MHKEVLDKNQLELLPFVKLFKQEFYLAGGTAIALHIGHIRSIDFDLFKPKALNHKSIVSKILASGYPYTITRRETEQMNIIIRDVMFTFCEYPFQIASDSSFSGLLRLPDLEVLAAMKAYALGRRSKWKDYVDMYFILKDFLTIEQISE